MTDVSPSSSLTVPEFIARWQGVTLTERSAAQSHFIDLCDLLDQSRPVAADPEGSFYTFERGVHETSGGDGLVCERRSPLAAEMTMRTRSATDGGLAVAVGGFAAVRRRCGSRSTNWDRSALTTNRPGAQVDLWRLHGPNKPIQDHPSHGRALHGVPKRTP